MQALKLAILSDSKFDNNEPVNERKNEATIIKKKKKRII